MESGYRTAKVFAKCHTAYALRLWISSGPGLTVRAGSSGGNWKFLGRRRAALIHVSCRLTS